MKDRTILHVILSILIFVIIDRIIKFVGTYQRDNYKEKHNRIRVELTLTAIATIFIIISLKTSGHKLFL
jgi:hypothetical protein